jgi:putative ABC transport system ATP-binding protein
MITQLPDRPYTNTGRALITLTRVSRRFRSAVGELVALDEVDLALQAGEFVALTGPSGGGKTTLLNILGLLDRPTSGSYRLQGRELIGASEDELTRVRRGNIGFVFQGFNLLRELTVVENVELPLLGTALTSQQRRDRVREVLELVELDECGASRPGQLSGGQQQRAAIARAIVGDPRLVLADEPTGDLDADGESGVMDLLRTLSSLGTTVVMATHSTVFEKFVDRRIHLASGRLC